MDLGTQQREERVGRIERAALTYIHYHVENRWLVGSCCITRGACLVLRNDIGVR